MTSRLWSNAIFDYLNNNPHKFDEHGNFDPEPDPRDYLPMAGSAGGTPWWWKYVSRDTTPDDVSRERNAAELQDWENGVRHTKEECLDEYEKDIELCDDGPGGRVREACYKRAADRLSNCYSTGSYNRLGRWTFQDATGQPQGDKDPDRRAKKAKANPKPKPEGNPDKSDREMVSGPIDLFLMTNPLFRAYLAANPEAARVLRDSSPDFRALARNFVLMPSDYPKEMQPLSPYSPPPYLAPALGALIGPVGGPAAIGARLRTLALR
jgi:hypothetical protein